MEEMRLMVLHNPVVAVRPESLDAIRALDVCSQERIRSTLDRLVELGQLADDLLSQRIKVSTHAVYLPLCISTLTSFNLTAATALQIGISLRVYAQHPRSLDLLGNAMYLPMPPAALFPPISFFCL